MNTTIQQGESFKDFSKFAQELAEHIAQAVASVGQLENAYKQIDHAITYLPETDDTDKVVTNNLMENILRRDMSTLLSAIQTMEKSFAKSIGLLIESCNEALVKSYHSMATETQNEPNFLRIKTELIEGMFVLRQLKRRLEEANQEK